MYCWNCGKEMEDDLLFCPHCAMKQAGIPEPKEKKKIRLLPILCGAGCALVILMAALIFLAWNPPEPPVDPDSVDLPDPAAFLSTRYTYEDTSEYTHYVTWELQGSSAREALDEYLALLEKDSYQLIQESSRSWTSQGADCTDYLFRYSGRNEAIRWVHHKDGYKYHVKLTVHEKNGTLRMTLYTAHGFRLVDPGRKARSLS